MIQFVKLRLLCPFRAIWLIWKITSCKRLVVFVLAFTLLAVWRGFTRNHLQQNPSDYLALQRINQSLNAAPQLIAISSKCSVLKVLKTGALSLKPFGSKIPKILHQTSKNTKVPSGYRHCVTTCRSLNPDWQYYLWRDEDIVAFVTEHFPSYMKTYHKFVLNVQRSDFIRYMILYHYGGIYLDMDVECVKPFFPVLKGHVAFLDQERKEHSQILYGVEYMAMNSAMGSAAGHPMFLRMLESIVTVAKTRSGADITTGPDRLTHVYQEWIRDPECNKDFPVEMMDPVVFSPIVDAKMNNFHQHCANKPQEKWKKIGCQLLLDKNWKVDITDNRTICKHLFLHLAYDWGPKSESFFDAGELGPVKMYKEDRMLTKVFINKNNVLS